MMDIFRSRIRECLVKKQIACQWKKVRTKKCKHSSVSIEDDIVQSCADFLFMRNLFGRMNVHTFIPWRGRGLFELLTFAPKEWPRANIVARDYKLLWTAGNGESQQKPLF
jgi:hypothetical protein